MEVSLEEENIGFVTLVTDPIDGKTIWTDVIIDALNGNINRTDVAIIKNPVCITGFVIWAVPMDNRVVFDLFLVVNVNGNVTVGKHWEVVYRDFLSGNGTVNSIVPALVLVEKINKEKN